MYQSTLGVSRNSEGTLAEQAEIYAESWEASRKRVEAAAQGIYDSLLNDEAFITINNSFANILDVIEQVIDSFGGLSGVINVALVSFARLYSGKIADGIRHTAQTVRIITGAEEKHNQELREQLKLQIQLMNDGTESRGREIDLLIEKAKIQQRIEELEARIGQEKKNQLQQEYNLLEIQSQRELEAARMAEDLDQQQRNYVRLTATQVLGGATGKPYNLAMNAINSLGLEDLNSFKSEKDMVTKIAAKIQAQMNKEGKTQLDNTAAVKNVQAAYNSIFNKQLDLVQKNNVKIGRTEILLQHINTLQAQIKSNTSATEEEQEQYRRQVEKTREILTETFGAVGFGAQGNSVEVLDSFNKRLNQLRETAIKAAPILTNLPEPMVQELKEAGIEAKDLGKQLTTVALLQGNTDLLFEGLNKHLNGASDKGQDLVDKAVKAAMQIGSLAMNFQIVSSSMEEIFSSSTSGLDKFISLFTMLGFVLPDTIENLKDFRLEEALTFIQTQVLASGLSTATRVTNLFRFAITNLTAVLSIATLVIGAVVGAIRAHQQAVEEAREARKQEIKDTREEIASNTELIQSYEDLLATYEETGKGKEELAAQATEIAKKIGYEDIAVANLTGNYENLTKAIEEYKRQQLDEAIDLSKENLQMVREDTGLVDKGNVERIFLPAKGLSFKEQSAQKKAAENSQFYKDLTSTADALDYENMSNPELLEFYDDLTEEINLVSKAMEDSGEEQSKYLESLLNQQQLLRSVIREIRDETQELQQLEFERAVDNSGIDDMQVRSQAEYQIAVNRLNEELAKEQDLTEKVTQQLREQYLISNDNLSNFYLQDKFIEDFSKRFQSAPISAEQFNKIFEQVAASDEELQVAIQVIPESSSVDEFLANFERKCLETSYEILQGSISNLNEIMDTVNSEMTLTDDDYKTIASDSNIMQDIEDTYGDLEHFQRRSLKEQIDFLREFYNEAENAALENLVEQRKNAEAEFIIMQDKYDKLRQLQESENQEVQAAFVRLGEIQQQYREAQTDEQREQLREQFNNEVQILNEMTQEDLGFQIQIQVDDELDTTTLYEDLDEIANKIDEINKKEIDIALNWDDTKEFKNEIESLGDFAAEMQDDAKLVGNAYRYSIDEVYKWAQVYPDLFKQAQVTSDGLIGLNKDVVDQYIKGREEEIEKDIEARYNELETTKEALQGKLDAVNAEINAFRNMANGRVSTEGWTNEQIAKHVQQLTDYRVKAGWTEEKARKQALWNMGLEETKWEEIVADVSENNAENMINSSAEGAAKTNFNIGTMIEKIKNYGHDLKEAFKVMFFGFALGKDYTPTWSDGSTGTGNQTRTNNFVKKADTENNINKDMDEPATLEGYVNYIAPYLKDLEQTAKDYQNAIDEIEARQMMLTALKNAPARLGTGRDKEDKSGGKDDTKDLLEDLDDVLERYHEITREIEYQNRKIDKLDKAIDRAYGKDKLDYFIDRMYELNKLADLQQEKEFAARGFVDIDLEKIRDLGLEPQVNSDSLDLVNYTDLMQKAMDEYQAFIDDYNQKIVGASDKQKEVMDEEKERVEKLYEDRLDALKTYEESVDTFWEMHQQWEDTLREIEDEKLNVITTKFELILDVKEAKDDVRDFAQQIIESFSDEVYHGLDSLANQYQGALENIDFIPNLESTQNELIGLLNSANEYTDVNAIVDELGNLRGEIISTGEALLDWLDNLENEFPDALADATDRFQVFTGVLEHNQSILDTIKELMTLQGMLVKTERGYTDMQRIAESSMKASLGDARMNKLRYDRASQELLQAEATLRLYQEGDAGYDGAYQKWKALLEETEDAEAAYLESARAAMEKAREIYTNAIEKAAYDFEQILSKNQGFDLLQSKFDNFIDEEERYLDAVNKIYETTKLNDKVQASLDNATDAAQAAKLKALQEEFKQRQANNKLSEYDIEIMEAKYNMILKEMALEEARNNNSQVRLRRNSQGNMSYYYTTDPDAIADAEGEYNDAAQEWYNLAKDRVKETSGEIIEAWQEMNEQIKEIYNDESLTVEEREAQIAEIRRHYSEILQDLESEKQKAIKDMTEAGEIVIDDFENNYADSMDSMSEAVENFDERFDDCINQMNEAFYNYGQTTQEIGGATGTTYDELSQKIDQTTWSTQEFTNAGLEATNEMWNSLSALQDQIDKYLELAAAIAQAIEQLRQLAAMNAQAVESTVSNNVQYKETYDADTDYMAEALKYAAQGKSELAAEALRKRWAKTEDLGIDYNRDADIQRVQGVLGGTAAQKQELYDYLTQGPYDSYGASQRADAMRGNTISNSSLSTISSAIDSTPINLPRVNTSNYNSNIVNNNNNARSNVYNVQANFPNASNTQEIQDAILGLENYASQYVYTR